MITDLGAEIQNKELQPHTFTIQPFLRGVRKFGPEGKYEGREVWEGQEFDLKSLGEMQAVIIIPRDEQAVEETPEWRNNQPVYVVDKNGKVSEGRSNDFLEGYGSLRVNLGPPEHIFHELYRQQNLVEKKVPKVDVDVIVWLSEDAKFRGLLEDILGEGHVLEFYKEDSEGKPIGDQKPVLFATDEELLKKINVAFETYIEPLKRGGI